jgi:hypothetical protein
MEQGPRTRSQRGDKKGPLLGPTAASARYLSSRVRRGSYSLSCLASDGSLCPVDNRGHLLAAFFVSEAMGRDLSERERGAILTRIAQEQRFGAWGYATEAPIDADDTAFALRTARNLGGAVDANALESFFHDGAYTTFEGGKKRERTQLVFDVCSANNFQVHPEVLTNIYVLLAELGDLTRTDDALVQASQAPEGYFRTYFYPSRYYGTWLSLDFLAKAPRLTNEQGKAVQFLSESQNQNGSWGRPENVYETALALNSYSQGEIDQTKLRKAVQFLLESQYADGSWSAQQPIWKFRHRDAPVVTWEAYDNNRVVTTALALKALKRIRSWTR